MTLTAAARGGGGGATEVVPARVRPPAATAALAAASVTLVGAASAYGLAPGVIAVAVAVSGTYLVLRPAWSGLLLAGAVPALSGLARGVVVPGLRVSEVLIVGLAGVALVLGRSRQTPRWGVLDWSLVAYAVATVALGLLGHARMGRPLDVEAVGTLAGPIQWVLLSRAIIVSLDTAALRRRALRLVLFASVPVALLALLQYFALGPVRQVLTLLTGTDIFADNTLYFEARATGPFEHWHLLAGYLLIVILLALALRLTPRQDVLGRREAVVVLGAAVAGLVLTLTLVALAGLVLGVVLVAAWSGRLAPALRWSALVAVASVVLFAPFLVGRIEDQLRGAAADGRPVFVPETVDYRLDVWAQQYLPALEGHWLVGYGPALPPDATWQFTESAYLELVLRGGLPLLVVFLAYQWALVTTGVDLARSADPTISAPARAAAVSGLVLLPMQALFPYFLNVGLPHLVVVVAAVALAGGGAARGPARKERVPMVDRPAGGVVA